MGVSKTVFAGTKPYMAPEMLNQEGIYSYPIDIWSLGVLAFKILTNEFPSQKGKIVIRWEV